MIKAMAIISFDYTPTEDRYFFSFLSLQSSCVYSPQHFCTTVSNSVKTIIQANKNANYCSIPAINGHGWLLCTKANRHPGERVGCRSQM